MMVPAVILCNLGKSIWKTIQMDFLKIVTEFNLMLFNTYRIMKITLNFYSNLTWSMIWNMQFMRKFIWNMHSLSMIWSMQFMNNMVIMLNSDRFNVHFVWNSHGVVHFTICIVLSTDKTSIYVKCIHCILQTLLFGLKTVIVVSFPFSSLFPW